MRVIVLALVLIFGALACGDDDPVPIDEIPPDTRLVELNSAEWEGFCEWGRDLARREIPPGTTCNGIPITYQGCMRVPADCPATVSETMTCSTAWLDRLAQDPCMLLDLILRPSAFADFVESTPGCKGFGQCTTVNMGTGG
jgi:hypothetical protein